MRGPLSYIGGKNRLAKVIVPMIPKHTSFIEPFAGGAQILFHKTPSKTEILNDLDGELVNFYRVCQSHYEELVRYMRYMIVSREWFKLLESVSPNALTDIQKAARYLYLQKLAFGGRVTRKAYAIHVASGPGFNPETLEKQIEETHKRLARVQIENLPYEKILRLYDRPDSFFFLDPPYYNIRLYRYNFEHDDFVKLAENLKKLKGNFLLTLNDRVEVRNIFAEFKITTVPITYSLHGVPGKRHQELIIQNY